MVIWVVNHHADPPEGMATRTFDLCRRWVEKGHPATIFVSNINHYDFRPRRSIRGFRLWLEENLDGVCMVWIRTTPYRGNGIGRVINQLTFAVLALMAGGFRGPRPEIVIGVSVHPLAALSGWLLARRHGSRFFFEVTDLWPQTLIEFGRLRANGVPARVLRALERFLYQRAERIVMLWRHTDDYVESLGVSSQKILWVPHGVELHRYAGLSEYRGTHERPFRVVYLGGFVESMAIDTLLEGARRLQERGRLDIVFLLFGSGTHREHYIQMAEQMGLKNVQFPPAVPKRDIAQAMNQADAFVYGLRDLPLYRFGMSLNKLSDYLAGGRPIVFYGRSSYDPVRDARAGFSVPPDDPEALAVAFEKLVALSPEERLEMGRRGRQYLLEHHDIPGLADRLLTAFGAPASRKKTTDSLDRSSRDH
jgi:glycosyltransferase involved in cell wall biosynthesis